MRDLLSNLGTNLHILVVSMLIVGLGLGMISSSSTNPRTGKNKHNSQSAITLSTTPSAPPKQSQPQSQPEKRPQPAPQQSSHPGTVAAAPASPNPSEHDSSLVPGTDTAAVPPTGPSDQLQPCAMCDDTAECPGSCLKQGGLPWRRPQPPITICCGGRTVSIAYQPDFVICPTSCTDGTS